MLSSDEFQTRIAAALQMKPGATEFYDSFEALMAVIFVESLCGDEQFRSDMPVVKTVTEAYDYYLSLVSAG